MKKIKNLKGKRQNDTKCHSERSEESHKDIDNPQSAIRNQILGIFLLLFLLFSLTPIPYSLTPAFAWDWQNPKPQGNFLNSVYFVDNNTGYTVGYMTHNIKDGGENKC